MNPVSRTELIKRLRKLGYEGPFHGSKHNFMRRGRHKLRIPNPHGDDINVSLLIRILREVGISKEEWDRLGE
ncbi:YcfA-like protein [Moorella thermoacetica]|uniref:YcfA-like protein n=1 Tax=Neomoorella thermoacetica TaxID=1525 RepID=A0A1J5JRM0_NEOTH|nr:YcfA-like protein [Moorella thermoacetica]